jgi:hypothetical protein
MPVQLQYGILEIRRNAVQVRKEILFVTIGFQRGSFGISEASSTGLSTVVKIYYFFSIRRETSCRFRGGTLNTEVSGVLSRVQV